MATIIVIKNSKALFLCKINLKMKPIPILLLVLLIFSCKETRIKELPITEESKSNIHKKTL